MLVSFPPPTSLPPTLPPSVAATRKEVRVATDSGLEEDSEATSISVEGNFLDDVIRVLLNARRVLSASYCIGYFVPPESKDLIQAHETLQVLSGELYNKTL